MDKCMDKPMLGFFMVSIRLTQHVRKHECMNNTCFPMYTYFLFIYIFSFYQAPADNTLGGDQQTMTPMKRKRGRPAKPKMLSASILDTSAVHSVINYFYCFLVYRFLMIVILLLPALFSFC